MNELATKLAEERKLATKLAEKLVDSYKHRGGDRRQFVERYYYELVGLLLEAIQTGREIEV